MSSYDLLIKGGTVVDGTGAPPFAADIAIQAGRIAAIGAIESGDNAPVLDASGHFVSPGFIDIHSHSDYTLLIDPRAVSSISQGVTLEVVGNCGHGCAPIVDPEIVKMNIYGYRAGDELSWRTMAGYLERLDQARPAVNVLTLTPNGNLRLAALGMADRPADAGELQVMKKMLAQSLEEGSFGFSTGLEYGPERGCSEAEIAELCAVTANSGGLYATHTRNRSGEAVEAIAEAIRAAEASGARLQISHISSVARLVKESGWAVEQALGQVDTARSSGLDVAFDMHTRSFGTTNLSAALPPQIAAGEKAEIAKRLRDPATRAELKRYHSIITALAGDDWQRIVVFDSKAQPEIRRRSIAEIAQERDIEPLDAVYDLLLAEIDDLHSLMIIAFAYRSEDLQQAFLHPQCMVGSDATALAPDGPLSGTAFHGAYTWAAWFYRHFVREMKAFSPEEAVQRMTSQPAHRLGLGDRGEIKVGAWADLAIFDPDQFGERGTVFEPNQISSGMKHVVVNGVVTLRDGKMTGERKGQVLRKQ